MAIAKRVKYLLILGAGRAREDRMKGCFYAASIMLLASATAGRAQTLDQTFEDIGSKLQAAQQSLSTPATGTKLQLPANTTIFTQAQANATPLRLNTQTLATVEGTENGFLKMTAPNAGTVYVPLTDTFGSSATSTSIVGQIVNTQVQNAMNTLTGLAKSLQNNPYVRLKGFSVSLAVPPSLDIDFEMRDGANSSPGPAAQQTKP
jgi:hypothetical protein